MVWVLLLKLILLYPTLIIDVLIWSILTRVVMGIVFNTMDVLCCTMVEHRMVSEEALVDVRSVTCDLIDARNHLSLRLVG